MIGARRAGVWRRSLAAVGSARRRTGARRRRQIRLPRPGPRALAATVVVLVVLGGAYLWLRSSPLVAVRQVTVSGASGPDAPQIRAALTSAARGMTTLNVQMGHLHSAVEPYPVVKSLSVSTDFPHGMRISVSEQIPVAVLMTAGQRIAISADGTLLHGAASEGALPSITLTVPPGGSHVTGTAASEVALLAAAPYALLAKVASASSDAAHGLVVSLRSGPKIYFGTAADLGAKWHSAVSVLADSSSEGADYIDISDPGRPAAGVGSDTTAAPAAEGAATGSTTPASPASSTAPASTAGG
jgi:cell division protein FtsQ